MDVKIFRATIFRLAKSFNFGPRFEDQGVVEMWFEALSDLTEKELAVACQKALIHCKVMPSVAELREFVGRWMPAPKAPTCESLGAEAARQMWDHLYTGAPMGELAAFTLRSMGGKSRLNEQVTSDMEAFWLKQFRDMATLNAERASIGALPESLLKPAAPVLQLAGSTEPDGSTEPVNDPAPVSSLADRRDMMRKILQFRKESK
jgi:hypothetical protein